MYHVYRHRGYNVQNFPCKWFAKLEQRNVSHAVGFLTLCNRVRSPLDDILAMETSIPFRISMGLL